MMNTAIIWTDLVQIKKSAKSAKERFPHLTHAQRLDVIAMSDYGARHYHELKTRYDAEVASHVAFDGTVHTCSFCSLRFDATFASDVKSHRERHQHFEEALATLGFKPEAYQEREEMKAIGYGLLRLPNPISQREGALLILLSWFDRSLEQAIAAGRRHKHRYLDEYIARALHANAIPKIVQKRLSGEFGALTGISLVGETDWPPGASPKAIQSVAGAEASRHLREALMIAASSPKKTAGVS